MLMAIATVGVIGGALAFKASSKFTGTLFLCTTTGGTAKVCVGGYQATNTGSNVTAYTATTALSALGTCYNPAGSFYCKSAATSVTPVIASAGE